MQTENKYTCALAVICWLCMVEHLSSILRWFCNLHVHTRARARTFSPFVRPPLSLFHFYIYLFTSLHLILFYSFFISISKTTPFFFFHCVHFSFYMLALHCKAAIKAVLSVRPSPAHMHKLTRERISRFWLKLFMENFTENPLAILIFIPIGQILTATLH